MTNVAKHSIGVVTPPQLQLILEFVSVGSRQSLVKSFQCSCEDDRQATTVKRTKRHGDHFSKNARAANEIVGREQFATVSSCSRQVNLYTARTALDIKTIIKC